MTDATNTAETAAPAYQSRAAQQAQEGGYGSKSYWDMLDASAMRMRDYYAERGQHADAELMMTRSLSEALMGNDGD